MKDGRIDLLTLCTLAVTAAIAGALLVLLLHRGPAAGEHVDYDGRVHVAQAWVAGMRGDG